MSLKHRPFAVLKGRPLAQVIYLPVSREAEPEDGPPVEGAPAVLIVFPFGSVTRRSKREVARTTATAPAARLNAAARHRDVRETYIEDVRRGTNCKVLLP